MAVREPGMEGTQQEAAGEATPPLEEATPEEKVRNKKKRARCP